MQMLRIFNLNDPNVDIIYVTPYPISDDIINYYYKIGELGEIENI